MIGQNGEIGSENGCTNSCHGQGTDDGDCQKTNRNNEVSIVSTWNDKGEMDCYRI